MQPENTQIFSRTLFSRKRMKAGHGTKSPPVFSVFTLSTGIDSKEGIESKEKNQRSIIKISITASYNKQLTISVEARN